MLVETDDIVTSSDIAALLGVHPSAVSNWKKRFSDFPEPLKSVRYSAGFIHLYSKQAVLAWYYEWKGFGPEEIREERRRLLKLLREMESNG